MQQHFGEAVRQAKENNVFDLLTGSPQARAEHLDKSYSELGIILNQGDKIPSLDDHELAIVDGDSICGSLPAIEKRNLPEQVAGYDQIKDCILALLGRGADSHGARPNGIEPRADIAFPKYDCAFFDFAVYDARRQPLYDSVAEILKKGMGPK
jgi:hypothetical protein